MPQLVNKRLSVGYKKSQARELFVSITKIKENTEAGIQSQLYNRDFSQPADFVWLQPGEGIGAEFNLFDWYTVLSKGTYYIQVCYQADEALTYKPEAITKGIYSSNPKKITFN